MPHPSYRKGYRGEDEARKLAEAAGRTVFRNAMSKWPDLTIDGRPVSVKRRKVGMKDVYTELERHDYVLWRTDRQRWLKITYWIP